MEYLIIIMLVYNAALGNVINNEIIENQKENKRLKQQIEFLRSDIFDFKFKLGEIDTNLYDLKIKENKYKSNILKRVEKEFSKEIERAIKEY